MGITRLPNIPYITYLLQLSHTRDAATSTWMKTVVVSDLWYTYINNIQGPSELYADFMGILKYVFDKKVKREQTQELLLKHLTLITQMKIGKK